MQALENLATALQLGAGVCEGARPPGKGGPLGLHILFRQTKRKTEGPQHFAFPEILRENRGCLVLHILETRESFPVETRVSLTESWSGAKSEAKLRKSTKYTGGRRVNSRCTRVLRKIPGILPIWPKLGALGVQSVTSHPGPGS